MFRENKPMPIDTQSLKFPADYEYGYDNYGLALNLPIYRRKVLHPTIKLSGQFIINVLYLCWYIRYIKKGHFVPMCTHVFTCMCVIISILHTTFILFIVEKTGLQPYNLKGHTLDAC